MHTPKITRSTGRRQAALVVVNFFGADGARAVQPFAISTLSVISFPRCYARRREPCYMPPIKPEVLRDSLDLNRRPCTTKPLYKLVSQQ